MKPSEVFKDKDKKNIKEKSELNSIILYFNIKDTERIDKLPNFKPLYEYIDKEEKVEPEEWGKIVYDDIEIKLYGSSEIRYRFEELYPQCLKLHGKEV